MHSRWLLAVGALAVFGAGVASAPVLGKRARIISRSAASGSRVASDSPAPGLAANDDSAHRAALLEARIAGLEERLAQEASKHGTTGTEATPAAATAEAELDVPALSLRYEATFYAQPADAAWARTEVHAVSTAIANTTAGAARIRNVDCRQSLCRIEADFPEESDQDAFMQRLGMPPFDKGTFVESTAGGIVLFTGREGTPFPVPDPAG